jgi:hypothetical protein
MSPDAVVLEIFTVRVPPADEAGQGALWSEIDEQLVPAGVRRELARNGFRLGVVGMPMPTALERLLDLKDKPPPSTENTIANLQSEPTERAVQRRRLQLRSGRRSDVVTSGIYDELPLLMRDDDGEVRGTTYHRAQGLLALRALAQGDGRVRLELTPELHYGEPQQRWTGDGGILRLETGRAKRVFDKLRLAATLSPGQMLVVTCLPTRPGSLGHHFFTEPSSGGTAQKLLLLRVAQTQHDEAFAAEEIPAAE